MNNIIYFPLKKTLHELTHVCIDDAFTLEEVDKIVEIASVIPTTPAKKLVNGEWVDSDPNFRVSTLTHIPYADDTKWIFDRLLALFSEVNDSYFNFHLVGVFHRIQVSEYRNENGGHMNWHTDMNQGNLSFAKMICTVQLSDESEYEGGELMMNGPDRLSIASKKKGSAHFYPSYIPHSVQKVTKGIRKSMTLGAVGPNFS